MAAGACVRCGSPLVAPGSLRCEACGHVHFGRLVLKHETTGRSILADIDVVVGRRLLAPVVGEESGFASSPQFTAVRDSALGSWAIRTAEAAVNPTCVNGVALGAETLALSDGDVITIGSDKARLVVRIEPEAGSAAS